MVMIRLAIVEDDEYVAGTIKNYAIRYADENGRHIEISLYRDGDQIADNYKPNYDIILMDIQMSFMDGMTAAQLIREKDQEVIIIFITNLAKYALQGYTVDAFDFIVKPVQFFSFSRRLDRAVNRIAKKAKDSIIVHAGDGVHKLDVEDIFYIESLGHRLIFHTRTGSLDIKYVTMQDTEEKLAPLNFFRSNKGYLVNLEYVEGVVDGCAIVHGDRLIISRGKRNAFMEALTEYVGEEIR
jgi:DNA-binding LytR/AlgR family response regulator